MPRLLLFDIDGTLLNSGKTSFTRFEVTISAYLGKDITYEFSQMPGSTDPVIIGRFLEENGCPPDQLDSATATVVSKLDAFYEEHETQIAQEMIVLPGVPQLLDALTADKEFVLGIVSGNVKSIARRKLRIAQLDHYFDLNLSAFSDDSAIRNDLPPIAKKRCEEASGHTFSHEETWVIGDAQGDYECAQTINAKTLLVCTSGNDEQELRALGATAVLADLSQTDKVMELLRS